jgi:two-component system chemotaxis sensor kinase CheA
MSGFDTAQMMGIFLDEGREQLALLETNILAMERGDHSPEILAVIFRAAHTLKGSSRAMGFMAIGNLTHEMENVLDDLRRDKLAVDTSIINALLGCLDALNTLIDSVASTGTDGDTQGRDIPALVARLYQLRNGSELIEAAPEAEPPAMPKSEDAKPTIEGKAPALSAHTQTIRVDVARLDSLLNVIGELVIERTQIAGVGKNLGLRYPRDEFVSQLLESTERISRISADLQDQVMKTRMLAIDGVFQRMPRMVRDLAQKTGKEIDFVMSGGETEVDRSVLEVLGDPLIHLLRNSVDHGVEPPEERKAVGKPPAGLVTMTARHEESQIVIEITDDGRGMDPAKIKAAAISKGVITELAGSAMGDRDALNLIFASGFSTAEVLSDISGRGVGMDIVKSNLEKLGGRVLVSSKVGSGSKFTIYLPLTLAIVRALLITSGGGTYVLPLANVVEMMRLGNKEGEVPLRSVGRQASVLLRGRTVPLIHLAGALADEDATYPENIPGNSYIVVVGWAEKQVGLCVEALHGEQEVVIKSLGMLLSDITGLAGATILGDGRVALIVDPAKIMQSLEEREESSPGQPGRKVATRTRVTGGQ